MNNPPTIVEANQLANHLFREQSGKMVAALTNLFGLDQLELVQDIVQDTFYTALKTWVKALPPDPKAWLFKVAKNKAINALKRDQKLVRQQGTSSFVKDQASFITQKFDQIFLDHELKDSQLQMLFACCNPVFSEKNSIILTLKTLGGFGVHEISNALRMTPAAVHKSLQRTIATIKEQNIPFKVPYANQSIARLETIHTILYLMFNEGYNASIDTELIRKDLCLESARLTRILAESQTGTHDTWALLSLMYFNIARFESRLDAEGNLILLKDQDRTLWDESFIQFGFHCLKQSKGQQLSRYHLEAGIASIHCSYTSYEETNWEEILYFYDKLTELNPSPIIALNRAVTIANLKGPQEGLDTLDQITDQQTLSQYHLFHATKGDFEFQLAHYENAKAAYQKAFNMTKVTAEKKLLKKKIISCEKMIG
ncbi:sigma-70 family RNA polymerase sigma factor [Fulvivirgaceae bacterium BMA10]|uniref:Sigma-70 family RNA polymerase sigma factor n=1 Tax=Splendidivirga corallicola TaxID=3051826 RepID=A0ABT8L0Y1_9BACT|nr:sigma-70 family RNA polymerase sigma factor [Fulvivirgaceae bacterium BMA10]